MTLTGSPPGVLCETLTRSVWPGARINEPGSTNSLPPTPWGATVTMTRTSLSPMVMPRGTEPTAMALRVRAAGSNRTTPGLSGTAMACWLTSKSPR